MRLRIFALCVVFSGLAGCGDGPASSKGRGPGSPNDPNLTYKESYKGPMGLERTREFSGPTSQDPWKASPKK